MKMTAKWKLLGNGKLVLCRRRLWLWFAKFESYNNHLYKVEKKLNKKRKEIQIEYDKYAKLQKKKNEIMREIDQGGSDDMEGHVIQHEMPLFNLFGIRDMERPDDDWTDMESVLDRNINGIADSLAAISGVKYGSKSQEKFFSSKKEYNDDFEQETVGAASTEVKDYRRQQGSKKRNGGGN